MVADFSLEGTIGPLSARWADPKGLYREQRIQMPRPTKAFHQMRLSAATAWRRGDRKEAYELWEKAAKGSKEHRAKKHTKTQPAEAAEGEPAAE